MKRLTKMIRKLLYHQFFILGDQITSHFRGSIYFHFEIYEFIKYDHGYTD